jgi:hypothetical protein
MRESKRKKEERYIKKTHRKYIKQRNKWKENLKQKDI